MEHMVFRGSAAVAPGEFDLAIEMCGGTSQAATAVDSVQFAATVPASRAAIALTYLGDMLLATALDPEEWGWEQAVIRHEIAEAASEPAVYQALLAAVFPGGAHSRDILGSEADLDRLTVDGLRAFHGDRYRPEHMVVAVVGGISLAATVGMVEEAFAGNLPPAASPEAIVAPPCPPGGRQTLTVPGLSTAQWWLGWAGPPADCPREGLALELASAVLGEGRLSRLVATLREEWGWVSDIGTAFSPSREGGVFVVRAQLAADRLPAVAPVVSEILASLWQKGIAEGEWQRAKRALKNQFAFAMEDPSQLAAFLGYQVLAGNAPWVADWSRTYPGWIDEMTPDYVQRIAQTYLGRSPAIVEAYPA
ncbi:MAG: insulinase family protein [Oscillatoriales cyanobacterium SM2_1_8]|nr:insulinase family protein [Oscillatoriales cyanobacterium SM2_1_8]